MSNDQANIALVRRIFHEGSNVPNPPAVVEEIFALDFICHGPPAMNHSHAGGLIGPEHCMFHGAFKDVSFNIDEMAAAGDRVTCRVTAHMVQVAEFQSVKPSGRQISVAVSTTFRVEGNRVKEGWGVLLWD